MVRFTKLAATRAEDAMNLQPAIQLKIADDSSQHWQSYLVTHLRYSPQQIEPAANLDHLLLYRSPDRTECLALILNDRDRQGKPSADAVRTAQRIGAELIVIGEPEEHHVFQVGSYLATELDIPRLPTNTPALPRTGLLPKTHVLLPFRDDNQLRRALAACHDAIYMATARDPAAAFDLMSLVIAAKVLDERTSVPHYQFTALKDDSSDELATRLSGLLSQARQWLLGSSEAPLQDLALPPVHASVARTIFHELQDYSLTISSQAANGTDLLGLAYEQLVGATFRGELGSYFTPRTVADFIVRILDIRSGKVFDPSCGSAGLLIAAHRHASSHFTSSSVELFGNDINARMVEASRLNFLLHNLPKENIIHGDGLDLTNITRRFFGSEPALPQYMYWSSYYGEFDFVVANPPFAGFEKDVQRLRHIESAHRQDGNIRSLNRTIPFLETIVACLRVGGCAGVVIPTSVLNAEEDSFVRFRELLLSRVELVAIIGLPEDAFVHTGCGIHGSLLFFRRVTSPRPRYDVFVATVKNLGYDRLGRTTRTNEFPHTLDIFRQTIWPSHHSVPIEELQRHGRWDPRWLQSAGNLPDKRSGMFVPLTELVTTRNARWSRRNIDPSEEYTYFEVSHTDMETGHVRYTHRISGFELVKKGRIRNKVKSGDVLLPNHRDSLKAAGSTNGRSVVVVDDALDGVLTTDRFIVLRSKIPVAVLVALLNSRGVREQLIARCRGAASLDIREHILGQILVPKNLLTDEVFRSVENLSRRIDRLRNDLTSATAQLADVVEAGYFEARDRLYG